MKHKHAELIHAWADGAEIQFRLPCGNSQWQDLDETPAWKLNLEYRIKPEEKKPVVRWLWAFKSSDDWQIGSYFLTEKEAKQILRDDYQCLDWSRTEFEA